MSKHLQSFLTRVWNILISLKFAVIVMVFLTLSLITATLIESSYDTKTAQYFVYRSWFFFVVLALFGSLILAVAISRIPWKKKHIPFLMAHAGILLILLGSWITYVNGIDGSLRLTEGEVNSAIELGEEVLVFKKGDEINSAPFPWMPQMMADRFKPIEYEKYGVRVEQFVADSVPNIQFPPAEKTTDKTGAAVQIKIIGAPMGGAPEIWLWSADPAWSTQKLGPARFLIRNESTQVPAGEPGEARFEFIVTKNGELRFESTSPRGEKKNGRIAYNPKQPTVIQPGWRMPIQIQLKKFVPKAVNKTEYVAASVGSENPVPAILISLIGNSSSKLC